MIDQATLDAAERILGYRFRNPALLGEALTHASIAETRRTSNERLEFLGDAVLGMLACEHIFRTFPDLLEGDMTKIKSAVVSRRTCAAIAGRIGLGELLRLGKGMQVRDGLPSSVSAAVLESVIGALYIESGLEAVRSFLMPHLEPIVARAAESGHQHNFKSVLQQHAQQRLGCGPVYLVLAERGPDHSKTFEVCVEIGGRRFSSCWGASKKQAEQQAALLALRDLGLARTEEDGEIIIVQDIEAAAADPPAPAVQPIADTAA